MDTKLTNDADYLLCCLYSEYKSRRKNGALAADAKLFGNSENIQAELIPEWPTDDIDEAARELSHKGLITTLFADNTLYWCRLTSDGIVYMEHRFEDKLDKLAARISALRSILFG